MEDIDGISALMSAALKGDDACVQDLLRAKANPDLQEANGMTALRCLLYYPQKIEM